MVFNPVLIHLFNHLLGFTLLSAAKLTYCAEITILEFPFRLFRIATVTLRIYLLLLPHV